MASNAIDTGDAGALVIVITEGTLDPGNNRSYVSWAAYLNERYEYNYSFSSASANVWVNGSQVWTGSFSFDWRGGGQQSTLIASGGQWVTHTSGGGGSIPAGVNMGDTGTSGAGGPAYVEVWLGLTQLTVPPGAPTGVTGARVSDTQAKVSWSNNGASNGKAASNQIFKSVNGGTFDKVADITATTTTNITVAANQKLQFKVQAWNSGGFSALSAASAAIYTTPAAPSNVVAARDVSLNIGISFTPNVGYSEHSHVIVHGTVAGGVTTWDAAPLATLASGTTTYTHVGPDPSKLHIYQVQATAGALGSTQTLSNTVQLLAPPNAPSLAGLAPFADKAAPLVVPWSHNPVDTSPQSAYEMLFSTDGGTSWTSTGKIASTTQSRTFAANSYPAGTTLQVQVRTWGQATTGGSDGAGGSPWSTIKSVTVKTRPTVTIVKPTATVGQAVVQVQITFAQAEGASFVSQTIELLQGTTVVETLPSTELAATLTTRVANGSSYSVRVTAMDSNGMTAAQVVQAFTVTYLAPVPAQVQLTYLEDTGFVQVGLRVPAPAEGNAEAVKVSITRSINGATETIVNNYPVSEYLTFLDTTPTIHGLNQYTVRTTSLDGAANDVTRDLTTTETARAFLAKGTAFQNVVSFGYALKFTATPQSDQALVKAAGRSRPIGLYGTAADVRIDGSAFLYPDGGMGSHPDDIEKLLLSPGRCCYRDPDGRRVFGQVSGQVSRDSAITADFSYMVVETSA